FVEVRNDPGDSRLVVGQEFRSLAQEIAPRATFGPSDFQQQGVGLVLDLKRVHDPSGIVAGLVDEQNRSGADRDQHHKSRRQQQDLTHRAPGPCPWRRGKNGLRRYSYPPSRTSQVWLKRKSS